MTKLEKLIVELCPEGVEYTALGEVAEVTKLAGFEFTEHIVYSDSGNIIALRGLNVKDGKLNLSNVKYIDNSNFSKLSRSKLYIDDMLFTYVGTIGDVALIDFDDKYYLAPNVARIRYNSECNAKFMLYVFQSQFFISTQINKYLMSSSMKNLTMESIRKFKIPIPPLAVQEEIVKILDNFTELTAELTAELSARKKQYEYYREKLLTFGDDVEWKKLEDIADIGTGSSNTNEELEIGTYPFFVRSQDVRRKNTYEYDETAIITSGDGVGVGKIFHYIEGKYALHQRAYRIHILNSTVLPKFFFYYMKSTFLSYIQKAAVNSSVTSIRKRMLTDFLVPIPLLSEQERIVAILDRFDALCNDLTSGLPAEITARQKQYEYYRDKLLSFKEI